MGKILNFIFMKAITLKSAEILDESMQNEIHHTFGMEHYTEYVFKPRGDQKYAATIVMEDSKIVIQNVESRSTTFPDHEFIIKELDMDSNTENTYRIKNGKIFEKL